MGMSKGDPRHFRAAACSSRCDSGALLPRCSVCERARWRARQPGPPAHGHLSCIARPAVGLREQEVNFSWVKPLRLWRLLFPQPSQPVPTHSSLLIFHLFLPPCFARGVDSWALICTVFRLRMQQLAFSLAPLGEIMVVSPCHTERVKPWRGHVMGSKPLVY